MWGEIEGKCIHARPKLFGTEHIIVVYITYCIVILRYVLYSIDALLLYYMIIRLNKICNVDRVRVLPVLAMHLGVLEILYAD